MTSDKIKGIMGSELLSRQTNCTAGRFQKVVPLLNPGVKEQEWKKGKLLERRKKTVDHV